MEIKIITIESFYTSNCYIVDINNNEYRYLIDPCVNVSNIKEYTNKLDGIIITHNHFDHICELDEIYNEYKCKIYMNKNGIELLENPNYNCSNIFGSKKTFNKEMFGSDLVFVGDGDNINNLFKCLYTPGHSIDSMCYILDDKMFTGDTLFNGAVGRSDLYSGNSSKLNKSLKMLMNLKCDYYIYPGHEDSSKLKIQLLTNYYVMNILD